MNEAEIYTELNNLEALIKDYHEKLDNAETEEVDFITPKDNIREKILSLKELLYEQKERKYFVPLSEEIENARDKLRNAVEAFGGVSAERLMVDEETIQLYERKHNELLLNNDNFEMLYDKLQISIKRADDETKKNTKIVLGQLAGCTQNSLMKIIVQLKRVNEMLAGRRLASIGYAFLNKVRFEDVLFFCNAGIEL